MLHEFGGPPHAAAARAMHEIAVKLAAAPGAVKQRMSSHPAK
jgi:hypothetical protein